MKINHNLIFFFFNPVVPRCVFSCLTSNKTIDYLGQIWVKIFKTLLKQIYFVSVWRKSTHVGLL